jgi:hypothetical protein
MADLCKSDPGKMPDIFIRTHFAALMAVSRQPVKAVKLQPPPLPWP